MISFVKNIFFLFLFTTVLSSCYKQNIMFKADEYEVNAAVRTEMLKAEKNYILRPDDRISFRVETNSGEALIDPNFQLRSEFGIQNQNALQRARPEYRIQADSTAILPLVGRISLAGLTLYQADSILRIEYRNFYKDPYVNTSVVNRRVFVFNGENTQVIPLENDKTSLIEVLAASGGISNFSKAHNIRLIRGDFDDPYVEVIDLSTIEGMKQANLAMKNQDIVYVEPVRRVVSEATRDVAPLISLLTSVVTLIVLLNR